MPPAIGSSGWMPTIGLDDANRTRLRALFAGLTDENAAYVIKCLCVPDSQVNDGTMVDHVRLFRNRPDLRWDYRVHEQILPAVRATGGEVRWTDVVVKHVGYTDPALRRRKLERDLRLIAPGGCRAAPPSVRAVQPGVGVAGVGRSGGGAGVFPGQPGALHTRPTRSRASCSP